MPRKAQSKLSWRHRAARTGVLLARERLHPRVLAWAAKRRPTEVWAVAFSGGADSLTLLLLLWAHWPRQRQKIVALHFNHRLRGRESLADEIFCRKVCAALGVRFRSGEWPGRHQGASESEARKVRHEFFAREMKRLRCRTLWLAHQQDDIAETMLMRLARGSGTAGLAAPRPVQAVDDNRIHLRPLLSLKKQDLIDALNLAGVTWREDPTNHGPQFFRNRIRQTILPAWQKAAARDAVGGAALAREMLEEDDEALEAWLSRLKPLKRGVLDLQILQDVPQAVVRRALHRWMLAVRPVTDLSRQGFERLLAAVKQGRPTRFSLGRTGFAIIKQGKLTFQRGERSVCRARLNRPPG